jgi:hypothetical protein
VVWGISIEECISCVVYYIACAKEVWVEDNMAIVNGAIHWNIMFI